MKASYTTNGFQDGVMERGAEISLSQQSRCCIGIYGALRTIAISLLYRPGSPGAALKESMGSVA